MSLKTLGKFTSVLVLLLSTIIGAMIGSYLIASYYGFPLEFGKPFVSLGFLRAYSPISIFLWRDFVSVDVAKIGYSWTIGGVGIGIVCALGIRTVCTERSEKKSPNIFGDATFAKRFDLKKLGLIGKGYGVLLGKTKEQEFIRHDGPEHYAVIAPTRSGKGTGIVIPTLLTWRGSCIVYDLKEENFQRTAGKRSEFNDILYFNPNSLDTVHFNPLFEIRPGIFEVRDAQNIANMIIEPDRPGVFDHWVRTGNSLLTAAILHVLYTAPKEEKNLAGVAALLSRPDKTLTETLHEMLATKHLRNESGKPSNPHPGVVAAVRDVLNKSADDRSSVVSTVMGYLGIYRDPLLANCTKDSDFTVDQLVNAERPKSLYLVIPAGDIDRLRPIIRIMVNLICRRLTEQAVKGSKDQEHKHKLLLMLDEFLKLGRLEFFESALGFLAGYGIKGMLVMQSLGELKQVYGERTSLLDNTKIRVFYRPETIETAEYISKTVGQTTIEYKTKGESGKKGAPFFSSINESLHFSVRPLLTPREVLEFPEDESIIFVGGAKPIRAKKILYHNDESFSSFLKPPPSTVRLGEPSYKSPWTAMQYLPHEDLIEAPIKEMKRELPEVVAAKTNIASTTEFFDEGDFV